MYILQENFKLLKKKIYMYVLYLFKVYMDMINIVTNS